MTRERPCQSAAQQPQQWVGAAEAITQARLAEVKNVRQFYTNELIDKVVQG